MACLDETTASLFAQRLLPETAHVEQHLDSCDSCRRLIAALARGTDPTVPAISGDATPPERLGRYRVTGTLGAGGMGTVYAAYDPELDREIAVKLLRGVRDDAARARFVHEARALAKVAHPNVVAVFDVGTHDDQVFVAMERVAGGTLRAWLAQPRTWREVVAMFVAIGRGLAAVHAHGLVHRDFKPDNVLVDKARPRVADFGLASIGPTVGEAMGTPAYMAPEQFAGEHVDARADQFGFCVALYEALHGERPFAGDTVEELRDAVSAGRVRAARGGVPAWLRAAVVRGLAPDPAARYPSIDALLRAIDRDPARTRRRVAGGIVLAGALVGAGVFVRGATADDDTCPTGEAALADAWNGKRRAALAKQLGDELGGKVTALLDAHATRWRASHDAACSATQSAQGFDLRMACLADRKRELAAVVDRIGRTDGTGAIDAVLALPSVAPCDDVVGLSRVVPLPADPATRAKIDALRGKLAEARTTVGLQAASETVRAMKPLVDEARAVDYPPLTAVAQLALGDALDRAGAHVDAEAAFRASAAAADLGGDDRTKFEAWNAIVAMLGIDLGRVADARELFPIAEAALARAKDDELRLLWDITVGSVMLADGNAREAAAKFEALMKTLGPDDVRLATVAAGYAAALQRFGTPAELEAATKRMREIRARTYGTTDAERRSTQIQTAEARVFEAIPLLEQSKPEKAIEIIEPALADLVRLAGPSYEGVAAASETLGYAYADSGRYADSRTRHAQALEVRRAAFGADSVEAAGSLIELSRITLKLKDTTAAVDHATAALAIYEKAAGADAPKTGGAHLTLARALQALGRTDDAHLHATRAVAIGEQRTMPWLGGALTVLGELEVARGDTVRGITTLERALAMRRASDWDKLGTAQTRLALARARAKQGRPKVALELAEQAARDFTALGKPALADEATAFARALR